MNKIHEIWDSTGDFMNIFNEKTRYRHFMNLFMNVFDTYIGFWFLLINTPKLVGLTGVYTDTPKIIA